MKRFGRKPKEDTLFPVILWPCGLVALVYDVLDTEGEDLPEDVEAFFARGEIAEKKIADFLSMMRNKRTECDLFDGGDGKAGSIRPVRTDPTFKEADYYRMA
ncbi:hypothetical protein HQ520_13565 [bacterium]|nr:hypothetical protein [bacterium]